MTNQRPYLFDAIYRWLLDNDLTPHLLVDASVVGVEVPRHLVQDNHQIILNIDPNAVVNYSALEFGICFSARFSGKSQKISVPYASMLALFSRENQEGMIFPIEVFDSVKEAKEPISLDRQNDIQEKKTSRPTFKIVK